MEQNTMTQNQVVENEVGFLVRKYGLTIDDVLSAEMITADGNLLHVDAEHQYTSRREKEFARNTGHGHVNST